MCSLYYNFFYYLIYSIEFFVKAAFLYGIRSDGVPAEEETSGLPAQEGEEGRQGAKRERWLHAAGETALSGGAESRYDHNVFYLLFYFICDCSSKKMSSSFRGRFLSCYDRIRTAGGSAIELHFL